MRIGFIGLGIMGRPMAANLLKAGHEVWVNNRSRAPMEALAQLGGRPATRHEIGENCDPVITMLPNGPQVREVMQWLHAHDCGQKDHSAIARYYEHLADILIGR